MSCRIVLDIRNNGGGLFPAGVDVARTLLNEGDIVLIADSQGVRDSYPASKVAVEASKSLSVLVNRGTASASEVLAGALQDNGRAKIVGETTFGKGLIQTIVELSDGSGVAVTVARYQTPLGTDINKKGIQPDILIDLGDMPPTNGPGFCKFVANKGAAVLFDAKAAAKMPKGGLEKRAEDTESMPIDVTQYENAFISGQPSDSQPARKEPESQPAAGSSPPAESESAEPAPQNQDGSSEPGSDSGAPSNGAQASQESSPSEGRENGGTSKGSGTSESTGGQSPEAEDRPSKDAPGQREIPPADAPIADQPASVENASQQADSKVGPSPADAENSQQQKESTSPVLENIAGADLTEHSLELQGDQGTAESVLMNVPFIPSEILTTPDSEDMLLNESRSDLPDTLSTI